MLDSMFQTALTILAGLLILRCSSQKQDETRCTLDYVIIDAYKDETDSVTHDSMIRYQCNCSLDHEGSISLIEETTRDPAHETIDTKKTAEKNVVFEQKPEDVVRKKIKCNAANNHPSEPSAKVPYAPCKEICKECQPNDICVRYAKKTLGKCINPNKVESTICDYIGLSKEVKLKLCASEGPTLSKTNTEKPNSCAASLWKATSAAATTTTTKELLASHSSSQNLCEMRIPEIMKELSFYVPDTEEKLVWSYGSTYIIDSPLVMSFKENACDKIQTFSCEYKVKDQLSDGYKPILTKCAKTEFDFSTDTRIKLNTEIKIKCTIEMKKTENQTESFYLMFYGIKLGNVTAECSGATGTCKWDNSQIGKENAYKKLNEKIAECKTDYKLDNQCFPKPQPIIIERKVDACPKNPDDPTNKDKTKGAALGPGIIAAIVLCVIAVLLIVIIGSFFFYKRKQNRTNERDLTELETRNEHRYHTPPSRPEISPPVETRPDNKRGPNPIPKPARTEEDL